MSTIGDKIDQLHALRETKRDLEKEVKDVSKSMSELEGELIDQMDAAGTFKAASNSASVSITKSIVPAVENWDLFHEFIREHNYFHMLERRPAVLACREMFEHDGKIPGVVPFAKRKLTLNSSLK
jgi:hypothetical protein